MFHVKHCHVINFPNVENCCMKRTRHAFPIGCRITGIFTPSAFLMSRGANNDRSLLQRCFT